MRKHMHKFGAHALTRDLKTGQITKSQLSVRGYFYLQIPVLQYFLCEMHTQSY